ncbi:AraC family transcriptional regulator, regulatory protein of adaptative response / methylated-DNA-[protein]-cysteine methyltransferase [Paracoccus isoporae]|uniref:AraC family transcriptional regulator, regulatory protein of adaptative response / methylated-DNA-[protein]-cysteine methyltransferase n=1 Tax=Paracoccus isoporae TaxID=591205 RepID=A0A1G7GUL2_9RHOB|nr:methylated-DNA--[protein]-cysteine S-methyltransferase [Paracoccus isoporae]SDE91842.1 AraC family transcriptional regulator, regulatory protein of adaptative response / methylated-DNA-[protein]-cysteine methyltransferase [Paracoccus isoporae]
MSEEISYAWGESSLGGFIVATSHAGIVALEFADNRIAVLDALMQRFSGATMEEDQSRLADLVETLSDVIDQPETVADIPLDPRGSEYERQVWQMLRDIPAGETTNYGALAAQLGTNDARDVTAAIAANGIAILIPCHRVIKKDGSISGYRWGYRRKRALLEREKADAMLHFVVR